jgi:hypothetical protein
MWLAETTERAGHRSWTGLHPTAEQLFEEAVAVEPWRFRLPEERNAGWLAAQREAARLARLAAEADAFAAQPNTL